MYGRLWHQKTQWWPCQPQKGHHVAVFAESKCVPAGFRGTRPFQRSAKPIVSILGSRNDSLEFPRNMNEKEGNLTYYTKSVGRSWTSHWNPFGRSTHTPTFGGALVLSLPFSWCRCFGSQRMSLFTTYLLRPSSIKSLHCRSTVGPTELLPSHHGVSPMTPWPHDHCPVRHLSLIRNPVNPLRNSTLSTHRVT